MRGAAVRAHSARMSAYAPGYRTFGTNVRARARVHTGIGTHAEGVR